MRQPSIHISVTDLEKVLKSLDVAGPTSLAWSIAELSKKYTIKNRGVIIDRVYARKQLERDSLQDTALYKEVYKIYSLMVRQKYSFTPKRYKVKDTRLLAVIASVTSDILEFAEVNQLERLYAIKKYLSIGLNKTNKLQGIKNMTETIQEVYLADKALADGSEDAKALVRVYSGYMVSYTGFEYELPSKVTLLKFKEAAQWCNSRNIPYDSFIEALFTGLEWKKGIPSPSMFASDYGKQLVYEYMGGTTGKTNGGFTDIDLNNLTK